MEGFTLLDTCTTEKYRNTYGPTIAVALSFTGPLYVAHPVVAAIVSVATPFVVTVAKVPVPILRAVVDTGGLVGDDIDLLDLVADSLKDLSLSATSDPCCPAPGASRDPLTQQALKTPARFRR